MRDRSEKGRRQRAAQLRRNADAAEAAGCPQMAERLRDTARKLRDGQLTVSPDEVPKAKQRAHLRR